MSLALDHSNRSVAADVFMAQDADILCEIGSPGVAAAIWQRTPEPAFNSWIDQLGMDDLPDLRTVVPVHLAEAAVITACETAGLEACPERDTLASDVGALAVMMARILDVQTVRVRLDVADDVMCPKFHIDLVPARLLCTYRGAGTEYVPASSEHDPKRIRQLKRGAVGLFRGALWQGDDVTGILHRSPEITPEDGPRLLLVIDPVE
ncbi:DUF1826 domain-containing protein [Roseibium sp.]|uniref:DUF1826 domain-containing protein n=1 Tax=Roseibium sp. TaxID=1936156 RepID=UPI003B51A102